METKCVIKSVIKIIYTYFPVARVLYLLDLFDSSFAHVFNLRLAVIVDN